MTHLISVIIPAYNVAPYIRKSVQSVINQTYKNLQIILIEDGATDDTGKICDELASEDPRIVVIHQKNAGLSAARNAGLEIAKGEWIAFLDSDDWIEPDMYALLLQIAIKHDAKISSCASRNVYLGELPPPVKQDKIEELIIERDDIIKELLTQKNVRFEVWNKLWHKDLIGDLRFKVGQVSEDIYWDRILFLRTEKIVCTNQICHNYLIARPGNTNASFKPARLCIFEEFNSWCEDLCKKGKKEQSGIVGCIAVDFAISVYLEAKRTKQNEDLLKKIKSFYYHFRKVAQACPYRNKKAITLFSLSPWLYQKIIDYKK